MKTNLLKLATALILLCITTVTSAQTAGTLSFSYNQPVPTAPKPTYTGYCVTAVWIENNAGTFIKTKMRYVGNSTSDHLPTYAVKAGGTASNALASGVNVTDASTGATRKNTTTPVGFGAQSFVWDGKNVIGSLNGTTVADGVYKVWIESTWVDSGSNNHQELSSYSFTKGPTSATTTAVGDTYVNSIVMTWTATGLGIEDVKDKEPAVIIYPVPSTGVFNIDFKNDIKTIKVYDLLGQTVYSEVVNNNAVATSKQIDLSNLSNGNYVISLSNQNGVSNYEVILKK